MPKKGGGGGLGQVADLRGEGGGGTGKGVRSQFEKLLIKIWCYYSNVCKYWCMLANFVVINLKWQHCVGFESNFLKYVLCEMHDRYRSTMLNILSVKTLLS